jgi:GxxExxY protein
MSDSGIIIRGKEVYEIIGCAMEVMNSVGHGYHEKPYENALVVEFGLRGIPFQQQPEFKIVYKDVPVGIYIPDIIVYGDIIIDTKVIDRITDRERGQILNYMRTARCRVGLIINFRYAELEWERLVL